MKTWLIGVLGAIVGSLTVACVTGAWNPTEAIQTWLHGGSEHSQQLLQAEDLARKHNFFANGDDSWSKLHILGFPNKFRRSEDVIYDEETGLTWQQGGSSSSIGYRELSAYLRKLNLESLGGHDDWRLPSLAEAWTLLKNKRTNEGLHIDPVFAQKQAWIWTSAVTDDDGYGWFIFFEEGKPHFQNAWQSHAYVRAVRGEEFK